MSGAAQKAVYIADNTTHYEVSLPLWEYNVANHAATIGQTQTAATTEPQLPKGVRRRKRYYVITATGKVGAFTVLDPASTVWTSAVGTPILIPLFDAATPGADNATLRGRTGERTKAI